jgi:hypothetical protein
MAPTQGAMALEPEKEKEKDKTATTTNMVEFIHQAVASKMRDWVATIPDPDVPIIASAGEGESAEMLSPRQLAEHVESRTAIGEELVQNWVGLVIKNIKDTPL